MWKGTLKEIHGHLDMAGFLYWDKEKMIERSRLRNVFHLASAIKK